MSVLDTSVILKWFVDEEDSVQALRIRDEFYNGNREIIVPDLLLFEVSNALRYNPSFTVEEIKEAMRTIFDVGIEIITPTYSLLASAIELAKKLDVTCYDAVYLALAADLDFDFITADEKFYRKVNKGMEPKTIVRLLSSLYED